MYSKQEHLPVHQSCNVTTSMGWSQLHTCVPAKKSHEFENRYKIFDPNLGAKNCLLKPTKYMGPVQGHWLASIEQWYASPITYT